MEPVGDVIGGNSERSQVRRLPELAHYECHAVYGVLDATTICHVGVVVDGQPLVLPSLRVRRGDTLLLHGSKSSLLLRSARDSPSICVSVTLVDGLIVARSAFNSSIAYRSAVVFGPARLLEDLEERREVLDTFVDGLLPGRTAEIRPSSEAELRLTSVVEVTIVEASVKISEGPPSDDPDDIAGDAWAGVVPWRTVVDPPIPAPDGAVGEGRVRVPESIARLSESR